jgi:hypothetical protein
MDRSMNLLYGRNRYSHMLKKPGNNGAGYNLVINHERGSAGLMGNAKNTSRRNGSTCARLVSEK